MNPIPSTLTNLVKIGPTFYDSKAKLDQFIHRRKAGFVVVLVAAMTAQATSHTYGFFLPVIC